MCKVRKERGDIAIANMSIEQQLSQGDGRNIFGQGGPSKQRASEVVGNRSSDGPADQVHLADEIDALLCLVIKLKHEAKDVTRVDKADKDEISRGRNVLSKIALLMRVLTNSTPEPLGELLDSAACAVLRVSVQKSLS